MDEIKVYHSVWKTIITISTDLLIVALGISAIHQGSVLVIAWFLVIFFSFAALITAWTLLKERITKRPYLTITSECIQVDNRKGSEIRYADVESFTFKRILVDGMIVVNYSNEKATPGGILVSDLTMKPKELLEILNERLIASKKG